jgi:enamine deaminase RidA (YjgF/YER057c/UK114 family)
LELPALPQPVANYVPGLETQGLLYISGQGPRNLEGKFIQGIVGQTLTVKEAYQFARQTGLFLLSVAKHYLGSLDRIDRIVKLVAFVRCGADFMEQPQVANGVSDLLGEVFGEQGKHARSAVGVAALPGGMCFEAELILQVRSD